MKDIARVALATVVGYLAVALGLSGLVIVWWIREVLPVTVPWILVMVVALAVIGWLAGTIARVIGGRRSRAAGIGVALVTTAILTVNIILGVAAEPLWFKLAALGAIVPLTLLVSARGTPGQASQTPLQTS